jgi:hypothetical protein
VEIASDPEVEPREAIADAAVSAVEVSSEAVAVVNGSEGTSDAKAGSPSVPDFVKVY